MSSQPDKEAVTWFDDINLSDLNNVYSNKTYTTTTNLISNPDLVYFPDFKQSQQSDDPTTTTILKLKLPTDDSPFYFAREQIPHQMIILLETVLGISAILALLLIYYSRLNGIQLSMLTLSSRFHILFAGLIGLGFIFLEALLMGFQFPSITRMAYSLKSSARRSSDDVNVTLLWGVNVIASVIGTVLTAISSILIGFSNNLLIGAWLRSLKLEKQYTYTKRVSV